MAESRVEAWDRLERENAELRRALEPFARVAVTPLRFAVVRYGTDTDPERQTFQTPTMARAFNRAAEVLRAHKALGVMDTLPPDTMDTSGQCAAEGSVCPHVSKCNANNGCIAARGVKASGVTIHLGRDPATGEVLRVDPPGVRGTPALSDEQIVQMAVKAGLDDEMWFGPHTPSSAKDCLPELRKFAELVRAAGVSGTDGR